MAGKRLRFEGCDLLVSSNGIMIHEQLYEECPNHGRETGSIRRIEISRYLFFSELIVEVYCTILQPLEYSLW